MNAGGPLFGSPFLSLGRCPLGEVSLAIYDLHPVPLALQVQSVPSIVGLSVAIETYAVRRAAVGAGQSNSEREVVHDSCHSPARYAGEDVYGIPASVGKVAGGWDH